MRVRVPVWVCVRLCRKKGGALDMGKEWAAHHEFLSCILCSVYSPPPDVRPLRRFVLRRARAVRAFPFSWRVWCWR